MTSTKRKKAAPRGRGTAGLGNLGKSVLSIIDDVAPHFFFAFCLYLFFPYEVRAVFTFIGGLFQ